MNFIDIITRRGFVHQMTDEEGLRQLLSTPGQTAYIGFDCTAKSLHVGSLLQIMLLRWWQKCGHKPIVLLGGATTKIGDPSGKDEARPKLDDAAIAENMESLGKVFATFLDKPLIVNNNDWLKEISLLGFLSDYGRHFSVNRMLTMDSVKLRLERDQPLSFLEFAYMLMQAYDFVELNKRYGCRVQMGGSDQWGNIVSGTDLNRRLGQKEVFGITSPLLTTTSGAKMGKSSAGAVWLNADMLKPYDYWQFWRNTEDGDVIRFLKLFTELPLEQIHEYLSWMGSARINEAKIILATEATALLHGREEAEKAKRTAAETFTGSGMSLDLPEFFVPRSEVENKTVCALLVDVNFAASNSEARRLIQGQGVSINDDKVSDENLRLGTLNWSRGYIKLSKGKKQHVQVKLK